MEQIVKREKLTLSIPETAGIIGISSSKMYELARTEGFPTIQVGKRLLISDKGLERWVDKQAEKDWCGS